MTKLARKIYRKFKKFFLKPQHSVDWEEKKKKDDYEFLINNGVETEYGFVSLDGLPIIQKHPNAKIRIGKGVILCSESKYNIAGINHPVILAALSDSAEIDLKDGCGISGTSIVAVTKVVIGNNVMLGVNTNVYDTDFHPVNSKDRLQQSSISEAKSMPVYINENVWIGANTTVLKGVTIGRNSVISSHSLVNKSVPENSLFAGIPAKFIKKIE